MNDKIVKTDRNSAETLGLYSAKPKPADWINDAKAGGSNLALGSAEYKEYVMDKQGLDEFEQEKRISGKSNGGVTDKQLEVQEQAAKLAAEAVERSMFNNSNNGRLSTAERKTANQIRKMYMQEKVEKRAVAEAAKTESKQDDKIVRRKLPKELEERVYDESVTFDDFGPGSKVFRKYFD